MKPRDYCCCAIPTVNAGIYTALTEQLVVGLVVGILSVATPSIVGAATFSFAKWILGIVAFVATAIQILGFMGVAQDKHILFRRYVSLHSIAVVAGFGVAAAWIIMSASRHDTAKTNCQSDFFDEGDSVQQDESEILCEIFPWVDVGIMGGLWVLLAIVHTYLYIVILAFSSNQERLKYDSIKDPANEAIPMNSRTDWDSRPYDPSYGQQHNRQNSAMSMSDVMSQPMHQPVGSYADHGYQSYPQAYTQDPGPTPKYSDAYYGGPSPDMNRPPQAQGHPAEGSFRRKTPRTGPADPYYHNNGYYNS